MSPDPSPQNGPSPAETPPRENGGEARRPPEYAQAEEVPNADGSGGDRKPPEDGSRAGGKPPDGREKGEADSKTGGHFAGDDLTDDDRREQHPTSEQLAAEDAEQRWRAANVENLYYNRTSGNGSIYESHGNQYFYGVGGVRLSTPRVSRSEARKTRLILVETASLSELVVRLRRDSLVFLQGNAGSGRETIALAALMKVLSPPLSASTGVAADRASAGPPAPVARLLLNAEPIELVDGDLEQGVGYVLDATGSSWTRRFDSKNIRHLQSLAGKGRIVVLTDRDGTAGDSPVVHEAPCPMQVFRNHLEYEVRSRNLPRAETWATEVMRDQLVIDALTGCTPQATVELAVAVATGRSRGTSLADSLENTRERLREEVRRRLEKDEPVRTRCFLVSGAVLNGLSAVIVSRAALELAELVESEENGAAQFERVGPPVWEQMHKWMEFAQADSTPGERGGDGRLVRLRRSGLAEATIEAVWEEHPTIREPLLAWLRRLTDHPDKAVRIKAAHTIGRLATFNFDVIDAEFLRVWSRSRSSAQHRLAAWALEAAAPHPDITGRVRELLLDWTGGSRSRRSVAARAYGSTIGLRWPDEALSAFGRIALAPGDRVLQGAVARSVADIYRNDTAEAILKVLVGWIRDESPGRRRAAALAFNRLAALRGQEDRPSLEALAENTEAQQDLIALWHNALDMGLFLRSSYWAEAKYTIHESWRVLADWVERSDRQAELLPIVEAIFTLPEPFLHLARPLRLHLLLWRSRATISIHHHDQLAQLVKEN